MKYSINDVILIKGGTLAVVRGILTRNKINYQTQEVEGLETVYQTSSADRPAGSQYLDLTEDRILGYFKLEQK